MSGTSLRTCSEPGCPELTTHSRCPAHQLAPHRSPSSIATSRHSWRRIRRRVLKRDQYRCHICHQPGADQVDHLIPVSKGGDSTDANLAACHARCNNKRGNR